MDKCLLIQKSLIATLFFTFERGLFKQLPQVSVYLSFPKRMLAIRTVLLILGPGYDAPLAEQS
jgi:hypothetical protein